MAKYNKKVMLDINYLMFAFFLFTETILLYLLDNGMGDVLIIIELGVVFVQLLNKNSIIVKKSPIMKTYIIFLIYRSIVTLIVSSSNISGIKYIIYSEIGILLLVYLCLKNAFYISMLTLKIRNFGFVISVLGSLEFVIKKGIFTGLIKVPTRHYMESAFGTSYFRTRTIFMHPTVCAVFVVAFWICLLHRPYKNVILNILCGMAMIVSLLGTKTRSSWISFLICTFIYVIKNIKWKKITISRKTFMRGGIMLFFLGGLALVERDGLYTLVNSVISRWKEGLSIDNVSNYNRIVMILNGINEWKQYDIIHKFLGRGNGFALHFLENNAIRGWSVAVDNEYITFLMDYGLIGLCTSLLLAAESVLYFFRMKNKDGECWSLILTSIFISGFFYEFLSWIYITTLMICALVAITQCYNSENERIKE